MSSWKNDGDKINYKVKIPVGTKARVYVQSEKSIMPEVNGKNIYSFKFIKLIGYEDGYWKFEVPSGNYDFTTYNQNN
jgi:hypothetical protein